MLGLLALLVRRVAVIQRVDNSVAAWGYDHRSDTSTRGLHAITDLGSIQIVVVLALVLTLVDLLWRGNRRTFLFLLVVLGGMELAQLGVKDLVGRVRPTLDPAAARLGPSFPSGHSATAAAFYAATALIIGRALRRPVRHVVIAAARGDRCRRGGEPRPARPALAVGCRRRSCARLGLVRALRRRLRRTATRAYRGGRRRSGKAKPLQIRGEGSRAQWRVARCSHSSFVSPSSGKRRQLRTDLRTAALYQPLPTTTRDPMPGMLVACLPRCPRRILPAGTTSPARGRRLRRPNERFPFHIRRRGTQRHRLARLQSRDLNRDTLILHLRSGVTRTTAVRGMASRACSG